MKGGCRVVEMDRLDYMRRVSGYFEHGSTWLVVTNDMIECYL
jgi:predicted P-loop ATPase/GTPase